MQNAQMQVARMISTMVDQAQPWVGKRDSCDDERRHTDWPDEGSDEQSNSRARLLRLDPLIERPDGKPDQQRAREPSHRKQRAQVKRQGRHFCFLFRSATRADSWFSDWASVSATASTNAARTPRSAKAAAPPTASTIRRA